MLNVERNVQRTYNMENFANFLFLFNQDTRKHIRNIENTEKKFIKCQLAILFNHTYWNTYIPDWKNSTFAVRETGVSRHNGGPIEGPP